MILAVIGKGGGGKTTVSSLLLRRLVESGETPVLAIDADPSNCLGTALGVTVAQTLADMREELRDNHRPPSMSSAEWLALRAEEALADLLTMGRPEGKGCYCYVNNLIRDHLDRLARGYRHVLLDCEAGLEHLSRRTSGRPDALICVVNRARMAAETIRRSLDVFVSIHGALPRRVQLVLNQFDEGEPLAAQMTTLAGGPFSHVVTIPRDPHVAALESAGESLLTLSTTSPAVTALGAWEAGL